MSKVAVLAGLGLFSAAATTADGDVAQFFDGSQVAVDIASAVTSDTISCDGYLFTYTREKLFIPMRLP